MNKIVHFRVIDHSQGGNIGDAELKFWADVETAEQAIKFYCDTHNKHFGTNWELYKIDLQREAI
jgi:hypothetical protein